MSNCYKNNNGFTLVEIMTVMVVMGLIMSSVFLTFLNSKQNANTSVEIVDLQQNVRVALETMAADIRMAGFLIPDNDDAVNSIPASLSDTNVLSLNLATSTGVYARVVDDPGNISGQTDIQVGGGMAQKFRSDQGVRIISPIKPDIPTDLGADAVTGLNTNIIQLTPAAGIIINRHDVMVQINDRDDDAFPVVVRYRLNSEVLQRSVNSTSIYETIATNISSVDLSAIPSGAPPQGIRAIRIKISGKTTINVSSNAAASPNGDKIRTLQTVVKIENFHEG